jgi:hypothetical protein
LQNLQFLQPIPPHKDSFAPFPVRRLAFAVYRTAGGSSFVSNLPGSVLAGNVETGCESFLETGTRVVLG